jgi:hypothetical protein
MRGRPGAIDIDATQPLEQVVDEPLAVPPSISSIRGSRFA